MGGESATRILGEIDVLADFTFSKILLFYQNKKIFFFTYTQKKELRGFFTKSNHWWCKPLILIKLRLFESTEQNSLVIEVAKVSDIELQRYGD